MNLALRAVWDWGLPTVEQFPGLSNPVANSASIGQQVSALVPKILTTANFLLKMGFAQQNLPPISMAVPVLRLAKSLARQDRDMSGMTIDRDRLGTAMSQATRRFVSPVRQVGALTETQESATKKMPFWDDSDDWAPNEVDVWDDWNLNENLRRAA
jgi:hypothetical protein